MIDKNVAEKIHQFCIDRWDFYEKRDGAYLPSKHDKLVFQDASKVYNIPESECKHWFNEIDKSLADKKVKDAIANGGFKKLCEDAFCRNGENPWGLEKILKKFYSIVSEMKTNGIKNAFITVAKNENKYYTSGHYLTEVGFSDCINIIQHKNGDIGIVDDGNSGYIFEIDNIKSVIKGISDTDDPLVIPKKMFRLLMRNGNIVTMFFDFKRENI